MKKILLLFTRHSITQGEAEPERLLELLDTSAQARGLDMHFETATYEDLLHIVSDDAKIINTKTSEDIANYDLVYHRRWRAMPDRAMACTIYLKGKKVPSIDREAYGAGSINKLNQAWRFWEAGLPHPATVYTESETRQWMLAHLETVPFGFPMIMKGVEATRGNDNYLVRSAEELRQKFAENPNVIFVLQEFLPNDGDYRVIVCGDTPKLIMHRVAEKGKHTNNTSQGGRAVLLDSDALPASVLADCVRAAQTFGRDFAGVDVVLHRQTGKHYFFEVNRSPQVESGMYVAEKGAILAQYLYDEAHA